MEIYETLYHHGIKGQKWGVRRFQKADGSYTDEGKKRRNKFDDIKSSVSKKLNSPKVKKAIKIGAGIAAGALAVYGGYKVSKYLNDQKTIMAINDNADTIKRLMSTYKDNIVAMNRGQASKDHLSEYLQGYNNNRKILSELNAKSGDVANKHLYNFGNRMTSSDYAKIVSASKNSVNAVGKASAKIAKTGLKAGKELADYLLSNYADNISEILIELLK